MIFKEKKLIQIKNIANNRKFSLLRLDPKIITMNNASNCEQRLFISKNNFPNLLIDMLIVTEDKNFYKHDGINLYSILRAFLANIIAGHTVQGGSTLTQQLVKNLFLSNKRSIWRKINEAYMALILDYHYSKNRILELYLNEIYFGNSGHNQIHGFPLASLYYFGKPINELSIDQQAMLVGMAKGASLYNPLRNPKLTLKRRNVILKILENQQIINKEIYNILSKRKLDIQLNKNLLTPYPAFMQIVKEELKNKLGDKIKNYSNMKIFTTLDPVSQEAAEKALEISIPKLQIKHNVNNLEGAMIVVDRFSGEVRAVVGGIDPQFAGFNRAIHARRLIGSLAKPAIYLTALNEPHKYKLNTWIDDKPITIKQSNGDLWSPRNYDRQFHDRVLLIDAFIYSLNVPTVHLGLSIGLDRIINTLKKLGIPESMLNPIPAMLLGAINLTPIEVAQKFQTIASGGSYAILSTIRSVIKENGDIIYQSLPQSRQVISPQSAYLTLYAMQQVVACGTSRSLQRKFSSYHLAAKTGTTNDLRDSWFVGIDGKEVSVIWIGCDNNNPTHLTGASGALVVYYNYLNNQSPLKLDLIPPKGIKKMYINYSGEFIKNDNDTFHYMKNDLLRIIPVWINNFTFNTNN